MGRRYSRDTGNGLNFPVIADPDHKIAEMYDMIHPEISDVFTVRSVYIIGPTRRSNWMIIIGQHRPQL